MDIVSLKINQINISFKLVINSEKPIEEPNDYDI